MQDQVPLLSWLDTERSTWFRGINLLQYEPGRNERLHPIALRGEGSALDAVVAGQVASEAECGQPQQRRQDACSAIEVGGLQFRERLTDPPRAR